MPVGGAGAGPDTPGHVLGGWGSGLNFNWEGVFGLNLPGFITIADFGVPVGLGGVPIFQSWPGIPPLDATNATQTDIPPQIDRRDVTSNETELPVVAVWSGARIPVGAPLALPEPAVVAGPNLPTVLPGGVADWRTNPNDPRWGGAATIVEIEEDNDVGWISDVYDVVDTSLGGWLPAGVPVGSSIPGQVFQQAPTTTAAPVVVQQGMPALPQIGGPVAAACDNDPMKGYVLKKYCGEWRWIKSKNRRRKQLVTQTDLKGLAALKGVLGGGKAFEVWIATHS